MGVFITKDLLCHLPTIQASLPEQLKQGRFSDSLFVVDTSADRVTLSRDDILIISTESISNVPNTKELLNAVSLNEPCNIMVIETGSVDDPEIHIIMLRWIALELRSKSTPQFIDLALCSITYDNSLVTEYPSDDRKVIYHDSDSVKVLMAFDDLIKTYGGGVVHYDYDISTDKQGIEPLYQKCRSVVQQG